jgi:ribosomal protein S18 acetylase RimI-like enzyme
MIMYRSDVRPDALLIANLYRSAPLYRPLEDLDRIRRMYENSNIVMTAWDQRKLVGILRGWTDGAYDGYLCDLAIDPAYQKSGIGKELLEQAQVLSPEVQFILRASKIAAEYYAHIGWEKIENGWAWPRKA